MQIRIRMDANADQDADADRGYQKWCGSGSTTLDDTNIMWTRFGALKTTPDPDASLILIVLQKLDCLGCQKATDQRQAMKTAISSFCSNSGSHGIKLRNKKKENFPLTFFKFFHILFLAPAHRRKPQIRIDKEPQFVILVPYHWFLKGNLSVVLRYLSIYIMLFFSP